MKIQTYGWLFLLIVAGFIIFVLGRAMGKWAKIQILTFDEILKLEAYAELVSAKLTQASIRHTVSCGSLLGIARYNTLIMWDDDLDFFIHHDDEPALLKLFPSLKTDSFGYQLYEPAPFNTDFFVMKDAGCGKLKYDGPLPSRNREYLMQSEWDDPDSIKSIEFGISGGPRRKIQALVGKTRKDYLERTFSKCWKHEAMQNPPHDTNLISWIMN